MSKKSFPSDSNTLFSVREVVLARPRGFCAGVSRAVKAVEDSLEIFGAPVYVKHEIVHNKTVVEDLARRGALTIEDIRNAPEKSVVVFSAHGSPPEHYQIAKEKHCILIDATCPLVNKVHIEAHRFLKDGYSLVYIGHKGHPEGMGVVGEANYHYGANVPIIETIEHIAALDFPKNTKLAYLTQTTLSIPETQSLITALTEKYPAITAPPARDICYATTNRQEAAIALAQEVDIAFVLGSENSSNSKRLAETIANAGTPSFLIESVDDIRPEWLDGIQAIGITAGASAPESRVQEVAQYFSDHGALVRELSTVEENISFREPEALIDAKRERVKNTRL